MSKVCVCFQEVKRTNRTELKLQHNFWLSRKTNPNYYYEENTHTHTQRSRIWNVHKTHEQTKVKTQHNRLWPLVACDPDTLFLTMQCK